MPAPASAASRVLHTTELFELIASNLDVSDLIRCSKVSKQWNGIVKTSPTLKHIMWKDQLERLKSAHGAEGRQVNPVLGHFFSKCRFMNHAMYLKWNLLQIHWFYDPNTGSMPLYTGEIGNSILSGGFEYKNASCRDMFLNIDTRSDLYISVQRPGEQTVWATATIWNANGIRVGDFLDAMCNLGKVEQQLKRIDLNQTIEGWLQLAWVLVHLFAVLWTPSGQMWREWVWLQMRPARYPNTPCESTLECLHDLISTFPTFLILYLYPKGLLSSVSAHYKTLSGQNWAGIYEPISTVINFWSVHLHLEGPICIYYYVAINSLYDMVQSYIDLTATDFWV
ncbi:hypothetical protein BU16DRAFT_561739 [Lophium mytilinum]|uniref:F-box domain-containing protein n=1 Tax=Lophium mytilinum TaxID=390894 RepID=A0A6A6QTE9_9PEZI|nr:hypothetical protein BU16DRAFT_561739 [Lophium mytilinum]